MQCPSCNYEPTMREAQASPDDCPKCGRNYSASQRANAERSNKSAAQLNVVIKDIDIPFGTMVQMLVKLALAAIPAVIILAILFAGLASFFKLLF